MDRMEKEKDFIIKLVVRKEKKRKKQGGILVHLSAVFFHTIQHLPPLPSPPPRFTLIFQPFSSSWIFAQLKQLKAYWSVRWCPALFPEILHGLCILYSNIHTPGMRERCLSLPDVLYTLVCVCEMILSNRIQSSAADGYVIFVHTHDRLMRARETATDALSR